MKIFETSKQTFDKAKIFSVPEWNPVALGYAIIQSQSDSELPFYLVNLEQVQKQIDSWRKYLPNVEPFYAIKCNPDENIIKIMIKNGCGFDVASKKELAKITKFSDETDKIILANPCKPNSHIRAAADANVRKMTFDNENELQKIAKYFPQAEVILRIATDDSDSICQFSAKFGAMKSEWERLIEKCKLLNLNLVGVSFHVGSGCRDGMQYDNSIRDAAKIFSMAYDYGYELSVLDIGGGFPGYPNDSDQPSFHSLAQIINKSLKIHNFISPKIRIIAEPGRYMVASAFTLITKVTSIREHADENRYYMNDGIYGSFNNILHDHAQPMPTLFKNEDSSTKKCSIWGPTCDGLDQICANLSLPILKENDYLLWRDMGAYTVSVATEFNGFPAPIVYYFNLDKTQK